MTKKVYSPQPQGFFDYSNFRITDEDFQEWEKDCRVHFSVEIRTHIRSDLVGYLNMVASELASVSTKNVFPKLDRAQKAAATLLKILEEFEDDGMASFWEFNFHREQFTRTKQVALFDILKEFSYALCRTRQRLDAQSYGKNGPDGIPALDYFVWNMGYFFEQAGGNANASNSPNAKTPNSTRRSGINTPFVRFLHKMNAKLPEELRMEFSSLAEAVRVSLAWRPRDYRPRWLPEQG